MATIVRFRLQVQPVGRPGIDRSISFAIGELGPGERRGLRGVVFEATDRTDALRTFRDLHRMAKEAAASGEVAQFLDALDRRDKTPRDASHAFAVFAEEWLKTCVEGGGLRESQKEGDRWIVRRHLIPFFGQHHLQDIDARLVDRFKAAKLREEHQYKRTYSTKTVNNFLSVLHRIFEKAISYGVVERNPVGRSSWLRSDRTPEESRAWWTPEEEGKAVAALLTWKEREPARYFALLTQIVTGIRFGELRALEKRDLDLQGPGLWIRRSMARKAATTPKNKKSRFAVLPRALADELQRWMLRIEGNLLFPADGGGPLSNNVLNRAYDSLCSEAGVRRITSHGARHTSGSSYAMMGVGQKVIAGLLGHADTAATEMYTHVAPGVTAALVEERWARLTRLEG
ncbi:MAG: site-specific integrase [Deltaproteobacteria bacterium]|nr:site-specific integrase [Deltaproteobacteria bacterium]